VAAIAFRGVSKRYADRTLAVRELDLEITDGELMILVGPSGCGKTTLLRMLAGLESITTGEILIGERVVNDLTPKARDIAMVFQSYALYPHMTVAKNMGFALKRAGVPKAEIERKVGEAATLLGIADQLDRKPAMLSGGQRQRVAMGRAIVRDPQAFLMDEPLSNLDAKLRSQMRAEILRIQRRLGTTTVYVTHDQTEAMTLGDRVAVMRDGKLQQVGTPDELYNHPLNIFVAGFIGSPAMNFFHGEVADGSLQFALAKVALGEAPGALGAGSTGGRSVIVGIRPEAFEDAALAGDRAGGITVSAPIDVLERTGSDIYAHLALPNGDAATGLGPAAVRELAAAAVNPDEPVDPIVPDVVARIDASSHLREGELGRLWLDTRKLHLFDPGTGERVGARRADGPAAE
jgi:multiple sugar transport system ATP-binding protein